MELSQEEIDKIQLIINAELPDTPPRGRPRISELETLKGILWVIHNSQPWRNLPANYPSYKTCHRRYLEWSKDGTLLKVLTALSSENGRPKF